MGKEAVPQDFVVQSESIVVTGGDKHLKFWWSQVCILCTIESYRNVLNLFYYFLYSTLLY
jgi:hypothetical protein